MVCLRTQRKQNETNEPADHATRRLAAPFKRPLIHRGLKDEFQSHTQPSLLARDQDKTKGKEKKSLPALTRSNTVLFYFPNASVFGFRFEEISPTSSVRRYAFSSLRFFEGRGE